MSLPEQRAIGGLLAPEIIELLDSKQPKDVRAALSELLVPEIAEVLMVLDAEHRSLAFRLIPSDRAPDVFSYFAQEDQEQLLHSLTGDHAARILDEMDPDDRVNFIEDAPDALAERLLARMRPEERAETERILEYPDESIGRLMTPEYVTVQPEWTVHQALEYIRRVGHDAETIYTVYVVDDLGLLINHLSLKRLILSEPHDRISKHLKENRQTVRLAALDDREEAVRSMEMYDLFVLPVVNEKGALVGIVTFDDVADVAEEEVTEDIQKLGGMEALDTNYLSASILELVRKRVVWLAILFVAGMLTVTAMGAFHEQLESTRILALFVPLIIASGGNSGSQAASLMIRSLALGEVEVGNWALVAKREFLSGIMLGGVLGLLGLIVGFAATFVLGYLESEPATMTSAIQFGLALGLGLVGVVLVGSLTGSMLPIGLQKLGLDPATSSTPFVATIADVAGIIIYFVVALLILDI